MCETEIVEAALAAVKASSARTIPCLLRLSVGLAVLVE